jgi:hypothetical protein
MRGRVGSAKVAMLSERGGVGLLPGECIGRDELPPDSGLNLVAFTDVSADDRTGSERFENKLVALPESTPGIMPTVRYPPGTQISEARRSNSENPAPAGGSLTGDCT